MNNRLIRNTVVASGIAAASVIAFGFAMGQAKNALAFAIGLLVGSANGLLVQRSLALGLGFTALSLVRLLVLTGLGLGVSLLGLVGKLSRTILAIGRATGKPFGDPVVALLAVSVGLTGPGILLGIGSHTLMGHYALMLKKHAKRIWRRWRKSRRPTNRSSKS